MADLQMTTMKSMLYPLHKGRTIPKQVGHLAMPTEPREMQPQFDHLQITLIISLQQTIPCQIIATVAWEATGRGLWRVGTRDQYRARVGITGISDYTRRTEARLWYMWGPGTDETVEPAPYTTYLNG